MNLGTLGAALQGYQQGDAWAQQQRERAQQQAALAALGRALSQPQQAPQPAAAAPEAGTGMNPTQAAQATQTAQGVAQLAGWPNGGGGGPVAPNAAPLSPVPQGGLTPQVVSAMKTMMAQGGGQPQQAPKLAQPGTPSMAQPSPKQPPVPGVSSTAQPDAAGMDNVVLAGQQTLQAIAKGITATNPGIDPATLALAVQTQIQNLKGITPELKASMESQVKLAQMQIQQQRVDAYVQNIYSEMNSRLSRAKTDEERLAILRDGIDKTYAARMAGIEASERNTDVRANTAVTTTGMRDKTSRDNNRDTNARQDRGAGQRQSAQDQQTYRSVYAAYLRQHPKDTDGATKVARAAVNDVQRGTRRVSPPSNVPSGDPLAGQGRGSAPAKGSSAMPAGARKAPDGHYYVKRGNQYYRVDS